MDEELLQITLWKQLKCTVIAYFPKASLISLAKVSSHLDCPKCVGSLRGDIHQLGFKQQQQIHCVVCILVSMIHGVTNPN